MLVLVQDLQLVIAGHPSEEQVAVAHRGAHEVLPLGGPEEVVVAVGPQDKSGATLLRV